MDGSGRPARKNQIIHIEAGRISRIQDAGCPLPPGLSVSDLSDCTVFPGLSDSHTHLLMSGSTDPAIRAAQLENTRTDDEKQAIIAGHLTDYLKCGVVMVREGGDPGGDILRYKLGPGRNASVTIAAPGRARHAPGRYGKLIGIPVDPETSAFQDLFAESGQPDHIKLVNSGLNSLKHFGVETPPQFTADALSILMAAARQKKLPVMVHANGVLPVKLAVEAGCASIEHGFFMGRENLARMADLGVVWVPTAVTMRAYAAYLAEKGDTALADVAQKNLDHQLDQIRMAAELGVVMAVGTDAGSPGVYQGLAVKTEIELFMAAGMSVETAVRCAARNGARLMGFSDRGKIAPGMRADLMGVRADPQAVPDALHHIVFRMIAGHRIKAFDVLSLPEPSVMSL